MYQPMKLNRPHRDNNNRQPNQFALSFSCTPGMNTRGTENFCPSSGTHKALLTSDGVNTRTLPGTRQRWTQAWRSSPILPRPGMSHVLHEHTSELHTAFCTICAGQNPDSAATTLFFICTRHSVAAHHTIHVPQTGSTRERHLSNKPSFPEGPLRV